MCKIIKNCLHHSKTYFTFLHIIGILLIIIGASLLIGGKLKPSQFGIFILIFGINEFLIILMKWSCILWNMEPKTLEPRIKLQRFIVNNKQTKKNKNNSKPDLSENSESYEIWKKVETGNESLPSGLATAMLAARQSTNTNLINNPVVVVTNYEEEESDKGGYFNSEELISNNYLNVPNVNDTEEGYISVEEIDTDEYP